jgi:uncharacterized protein (DUF302 family)
MYHLSKKIQLPFNEAVEKVTNELKKEGFGIITTIDLKETFKKKIDADFRQYTILGACNPGYAYKILQLNDKLGVFLPCNIAIQQHDDGQVEVSIINPGEVMQAVNDHNLTQFATEVTWAMQNVLNRL